MKGRTKKESNVPNLRFREFEGEWETFLLRSIVQVTSGGTPPMQSQEYWGGDIPFISAASMHHSFISKSNQYITQEGLQNGSKLLKKGNLLLLVRGSMLWNRIPICYNTVDVAFNQDVKGLVTNGKVSTLLMFYWLQSKESILKHKVTGTGIGAGKLDSDDILDLPVIIPQDAEQSKIQKLFTLIDHRIETQSKIIKQLEALMQGLSEQLFKRQVRFKDMNGNDFPDWARKKLMQVYSFRVTNSFSRDDLTYAKGEVKNIHYGDIHTKFRILFDIAEEQVPYISPDISLRRLSEENFCREGDMVFADASEDLNDVGKSIEIVNLRGEKLLSGLHTILARPESGTFYIGFGGYLFRSKEIRKQIQMESQGTKVLSISTSRLANINLQFPCIEEQAHIANCLFSINKKIETEKKILQQYQSQKKYLLQNMFI